ncbi:sulfatase-like hydrolase/transferase [Asinibacterium sp. OR53]|uniref:sulfatase-like hydrolase/transferase n=1 Tax=Asinibacterium sp. OR53 TaxID=925409 RepID=UPI00047A262D|nr:sulfatase-like hydrolase/transferase [Asinibacterium sp. OR53]
MDQKIENFFRRQWYPYLYGLAFLLFKTVRYTPSFSWPVAINLYVLYIAITWLLLETFKKAATVAYAGIFVIICWASLLHVVGIAQLLGFEYAYIPANFYYAFYVFVLCCLIAARYLLRKCKKDYAPYLNSLLNTFLLIICLVFAVNGSVTVEQGKKDIVKTESAAIDIPASETKRDIVWILMDEYGSSEVLQKVFAFRNPFDTILQQHDFCLLPSIQTRFPNTLLSLNALFNEDDSIRPTNFYAGIDALKKASWIQRIERDGYRFVNLSSFDIGGENKLEDRSGYPGTYLDQLISGTLFGMMIEKAKFTAAKCDAYNHRLYEKLKATLLEQSPYPRFIWAHLAIPHEPFSRDRAGSLVSLSTYTGRDSVPIKKYYTGYLEYGNHLLQQLLDTQQTWKDKIVIITGDHGPRYSFIKEPGASSHPYAAVYIPEKYDTAALQQLRYISNLPSFLQQHGLP